MLDNLITDTCHTPHCRREACGTGENRQRVCDRCAIALAHEGHMVTYDRPTLEQTRAALGSLGVTYENSPNWQAGVRRAIAQVRPTFWQRLLGFRKERK